MMCRNVCALFSIVAGFLVELLFYTVNIFVLINVPDIFKKEPNDVLGNTMIHFLVLSQPGCVAGHISHTVGMADVSCPAASF